MAARLARIGSKADAALEGRYSDTDSSEDETMRAVPRGCLGKAGVAMVASAKAGEDEYARPESSYESVVDQSQFRNLQVGVGYQAPFVVRQPGSAPAPPDASTKRKAPDMASRKPEKEAKRSKKDKKEKKSKKEKKKHKKKDSKKKSKKRSKRDASSSSSSSDDDDGAAAEAVSSGGGVLASDGPSGEDLDMPRKLALFEALLLDRVGALDEKERRRKGFGADGLADQTLLDI